MQFDWNDTKDRILSDIESAGRSEVAMPIVEWMEIRESFRIWSEAMNLTIIDLHEGQKACRITVVPVAQD